MAEEKTAQEKLREQNEKWKAEKAAKEEAERSNYALAKSELEQIQETPGLADMYNQSAKLGSENLGGNSPQLKVHKQGKSTSNELPDGTEPEDGYFFYTPTQEQFETIDVHILTISRGYRAKSLEAGKEPKFNQIIGGIDAECQRPFILYMSGKRLSPMWEFGKIAQKYTRAKPFAIPMFALTIRLSTHEEKATDPKFGKSWVIDFEILKNPDGTPKLVMDEGKFAFLRDNVETTEDMMASIIDKAERGIKTEDDEVPPPSDPY